MSEHKTELRDAQFKRSYCVEPGCDYFDQEAVQGHCHTVLDAETDRYIARLEKNAEESLEWVRTNTTPEDYQSRLEAEYICMLCNWTSALDELVRLRAENAKLKQPKPTGGVSE